jgi:6-phosphogluconolactonase
MTPPDPHPEATRWQVYPDAAAVATAAAERILSASRCAITERGAFHLVLAGGGTPQAAYRLLAQAEADWSRWHIWFGDERCLPPDDPERNSRMAASAWLERVPIPSAQVHPIPAEMGPEAAAERYAEAFGPVLPFDLVLLGMGEDGHTASLFPGQRHPPGELVHPVRGAPKPPPERVTLGLTALAASRSLLVLVTGAGKCQAVRRWRAGEDLPVARLECSAGVEVLLDREADCA